jgi:hypothetical protein
MLLDYEINGVEEPSFGTALNLTFSGAVLSTENASYRLSTLKVNLQVWLGPV